MERPSLSSTATDSPMKGQQGALLPFFLHGWLPGFFKPMHLTKFLTCSLWTLPFPIPAGGQQPTGLQSAVSRAGPASQTKGCGVPAGPGRINHVDFQQALGCLGKPPGSELYAKG